MEKLPLRVPAVSHLARKAPDELNFSAAPQDIIKAGRDVPPSSCNEGPRSRFPSRIFFDAALRNLDDWVRHGTAPPRADLITVVKGAPVLDQFGNVTGGLRSPYLDVPDEHLVRQLDRRVVLLHRRPRGAVRLGAAA